MQEIVSGFGLIEGPVWAEGRGLYFSDVHNGGIHLLSPEGEVSLALPKWATSRWVERFYDGLLELAGLSGTPLIGGDLAVTDRLMCDIVVAGAGSEYPPKG